MPGRDVQHAALQRLGLAHDEARAYLSLLIDGPASPAGIALRTGMDDARAAQAVRTLLGRGFATHAGSPGAFAPQPLDDLIASRRAGMSAASHAVRTSVNGTSATSGGVLLSAEGYDGLVERCRRMVAAASKRVLGSFWPSELRALEAGLLASLRRGARVDLIHFASPGACQDLENRLRSLGDARVVPHALFPHIHVNHGGKAYLVADDAHAMIMRSGEGGEWEGTWTSNRCVVRATTRFVERDMMLNRLYFDHAPALERRYGPAMAALVDIRGEAAVAGVGGERLHVAPAHREPT